MALKVKQIVVLALVVIMITQPALMSVSEASTDINLSKMNTLSNDQSSGCADEGCCSIPDAKQCCPAETGENPQQKDTENTQSVTCIESSRESCCQSTGNQPCECNECPCAQNITASSGLIVDDSQSSLAPSVDLLAPVQFRFTLSDHTDTPYRPPITSLS